MRNKFKARLKAYSGTLDFLKENETITGQVPGISLFAGEAAFILQQARNAYSQKNSAVPQNDKALLKLREKLVKQATGLARSISKYALKNNKPLLHKTMNFEAAELFYKSGQRLSTLSSIILARAREFSDELIRFGIQPDKTESFAGSVEMYTNLLNQPGKHFVQRREISIRLDQYLHRLHMLFSQQLDPLVSTLKNNYPLFYDAYLEQRIVNNPRLNKERHSKYRIAVDKTGVHPAEPETV